ncbi:DUF5316 domain-containing protein [Bacillus sp. S/N-304-OC-R1]|uniref:DUF5316 domain-containing protein n=1 Tax=Bacillus sp. S/N-304-OC-R1 TaxID=2758034 RepID=UPI001C8F00F7|nr:DUF5316 domain-containing protein [Bacillus sp. S/N-304-OC-R1]MBY0121653.1 DUF5316 domain-containing protein [Bacillus sp. S/N-304-OC-R1]
MRYFIIGIFISLISILISLVLWGIEKAYYLSGIIGVIFLGISVILSGSMVSGDRMRANFATESAEDRRTRNNITLRAALIGIPNLVIALVVYLFFN